jgi:DNA-binding MarR family transcriptional regulator
VADGSEAINTAGIDRIVGYRLRRAQLAVFAQFLRRFAEIELKPADYTVLALIADNPGIRPSQVASVLGIQRANFVVLAAGLENRGLIERRAAPQDRRSHALFLTTEGEKIFAAARQVQDAFEAELVERLGGESRAAHLLALLAKLG